VGITAADGVVEVGEIAMEEGSCDGSTGFAVFAGEADMGRISLSEKNEKAALQARRDVADTGLVCHRSRAAVPARRSLRRLLFAR
jgi:hypothetical protein